MHESPRPYAVWPSPTYVSRPRRFQLLAQRLRRLVRSRGIVGGADHEDRRRTRGVDRADGLPSGFAGQYVHGNPSHAFDAPNYGATRAAVAAILRTAESVGGAGASRQPIA